MEKCNGNPRLFTEACQLRLDFCKFPVRRDEAAILVGVRIANHHLLNATLPTRAAPDDWDSQKFAHDRWRCAKIADRLEQWHDRQRANFNPRSIQEETCLLGQHVSAKHVVN